MNRRILSKTCHVSSRDSADHSQIITYDSNVFRLRFKFDMNEKRMAFLTEFGRVSDTPSITSQKSYPREGKMANLSFPDILNS